MSRSNGRVCCLLCGGAAMEIRNRADDHSGRRRQPTEARPDRSLAWPASAAIVCSRASPAARGSNRETGFGPTYDDKPPRRAGDQPGLGEQNAEVVRAVDPQRKEALIANSAGKK